MVAWLITEVPNPKEVVITILNYRLSNSSVGGVMERLYVERREGLSSLLEYTKTGRARCPWKRAVVDGVPWSEEVWCGSGDRFYWGRKVDDLRVVLDEEGREKLVWKERKRPDLSDVRKALGLPEPSNAKRK